VQPVYIESTGETSYPLLQKILVAFGDQIAFEDTLELALDDLFGGDSGADVSDGTADPAPAPGTDSDNPALTAALNKARQALQDKEAALRNADWTAFGEAEERLQQAIEEALRALEN
jgi:uncharacterized membrane protein (UPF0182 family)